MYNRTQRENVETGTNAKKMNVVYGLVVRVDIASDDHKRDIDADLFSWWVISWMTRSPGPFILSCLGNFLVNFAWVLEIYFELESLIITFESLEFV